jgi:hypothetical protein
LGEINSKNKYREHVVDRVECDVVNPVGAFFEFFVKKNKNRHAVEEKAYG